LPGDQSAVLVLGDFPVMRVRTLKPDERSGTTNRHVSVVLPLASENSLKQELVTGTVDRIDAIFVFTPDRSVDWSRAIGCPIIDSDNRLIGLVLDAKGGVLLGVSIFE
jgi:hypothetical protein